MTGTAYAAFLKEAGGGDAYGAGRQAQNVSGMVQLYETLGFSLPALRSAIECVTAKLVGAQGPVRITTSDAEGCVRDAGMAFR